jgi:hypothetical protein
VPRTASSATSNLSGGEGWNKRGEWLIAEKDKRKADTIDVTWLEEYKEEAEGEGEKKPQ